MRRQLGILTLLISGTLLLSVNFTFPNQVLLGTSRVSAAPQGQPLDNLALGKSASQSSTATVNGIFADARRAVDNNINGNMSLGSVSQTESGLQQWWEVDLEAVVFIDNVEVYRRTDCCTNENITRFYLFVSDTPFASQDLTATLNHPEVTNSLTSLTSLSTPGPRVIPLNLTGRYIRVQVFGTVEKALGLAEVKVLGTTLATAPSVGGQWSRILPDLPDIPVHISLLPNGKLLFWGRDKASNGIDDIDGRCKTYLWDMSIVDNPSTYQDERVTLIPNDRTNLFCSAHSFLPNGNLFVAGGYEAPTDNTGAKRFDVDGHGTPHTNIFNYSNSSWSPGPNMVLPRWYPSVVTLGSGETLIVAGDYVTGFNGNVPVRVVNKDTEILDRNLNLPRTPDGLLVELPNYPFLHLGPDGNVLAVSGTDQNGLSYIPSTNIWVDSTNLDLNNIHDQGTSVMYDRGKIMAIGGRQGMGNVTRETEVIDINPQNPSNSSWVAANPMNFQRYYATSVLMPDGKVFIVGGSRCGGANNIRNPDTRICTKGAIMHPEIYNPVTSSWTIMSRQTVIRMYHSVALLLPDARILVAGGGRPGAFGENGFLGFDKSFAHHEAEIFSPPYLFNSNGTLATRPTIINDLTSIIYGQSFSVQIGNVAASQIGEVVLVRLPSVTHTLNFDQRRVVLPPPTVLNQQTISVAAPTDVNECPPGPYMLFVLGPNRVPSVAKIVFVNHAPTATLMVTSNPSSGVNITVTPNDNNGQGGGATTFTRTYNRNASVALSAPLTSGAANFQSWQRDGVNYSTNSNVSVVMDTNHTMTAVYVIPPTATLNVTSDLSNGVNITVTPNDNNGQGNGAIPFTRTYNRNTSVTLTAPAVVGSSHFQYWLRDGAYLSANLTVTITMDANHTMTPAYRVPPPLGGRLGKRHLALASLGAVATASSTFSSAYPASAVNNGDGKGINWGNGGGWNDGTANSYPDWIQIDFGRTVGLDEVAVYTVQDNFLSPIEPTPNMTFSLYGITSYDVQYWTGTSWLTVRSVTGNNLVGRTFIFGTVATTKIRVLINNALQSYSRITEIEAYAYMVSPAR